MQCPRCGDPLHKKRYHGQVVGVCKTCHGILLKEEQLEPLIDRWCLDHGGAPKEEGPHPAGERGLASPERACPRCERPMEKFQYAAESGIELDRCPACQVLWLDRRDLGRLAAYRRENPHVARLAQKTGAATPHEAIEAEHSSQLRALAKSRVVVPYVPKLLPPLEDRAGKQLFPYVTIGLLLTNIAVFVGVVALAPTSVAAYARWGLVPDEVWNLVGLPDLVTYSFVHVGLLQLAVNLFFLWSFGEHVEDALGPVLYAASYIICGVVAGLLHSALYPHSVVPCVGGTGAVAGVCAAYIAYYPESRIDVYIADRVVEVPTALFGAVWLAFQGVLVLLVGGYPDLGYLGHLGGAAVGALLGAAAALQQRKSKSPNA